MQKYERNTVLEKFRSTFSNKHACPPFTAFTQAILNVILLHRGSLAFFIFPVHCDLCVARVCLLAHDGIKFWSAKLPCGITIAAVGCDAVEVRLGQMDPGPEVLPCVGGREESESSRRQHLNKGLVGRGLSVGPGSVALKSKDTYYWLIHNSIVRKTQRYTTAWCDKRCIRVGMIDQLLDGNAELIKGDAFRAVRVDCLR
jgi:hypothetical protein